MDRRSKLSDVPQTDLPKSVERSPLIDPRKLRSCRSTPASRSLSRSAFTDSQNAQRVPSSRPPAASHSLKTISELRHPKSGPNALNRSQSTPHPLPSSQFLTPCPQHIRSPLYRVNPMVRFDDDRPFPERMNYGIAGYNTARPRSLTSVPESTKRPKSLSSVPESKSRPRSFTSVPECKISLQTRSTRCVIWRSWTRRFRDKMGRVRVRDTCSKLLSRFRGGHL